MVRALECTIRKVRIKKGEDEAACLRERWAHEIGVAIQRRKAAMMRAVMPARSRRQDWLAAGVRDIHGVTGQLPVLEEEDEDCEA